VKTPTLNLFLNDYSRLVFSGFIKGELTRYARLCSSAFTYESIKRLFRQRLIERGYSRRIINRIFSKHNWNFRFDTKEKLGISILPFVLPFTLRNNVNQIERIIYSYADKISDLFEYSKVLYAHSKRSNIQQILCPSSLTPEQIQVLQMRSFSYSNRDPIKM
jgi:hypothetical protein